VQQNKQNPSAQENKKTFSSKEDKKKLSIEENKQKISAQENKQMLSAQENKETPSVQENKHIFSTEEEKKNLSTEESKQKTSAQENKQMPSVQENKETPSVQENKQTPSAEEKKQKPSTQDNKDSKQDNKQKPATQHENKGSPPTEGLACPVCTVIALPNAIKCHVCGTMYPWAAWTCGQCTFLNNPAKTICEMCGAKKPKKEPKEPAPNNGLGGDDVKQTTAPAKPELKQQLSMANGWNCSICTYFNSMDKAKCELCGQGTRPKLNPDAKVWECLRCGTLNPPNLSVCKRCAAPSPAEIERKKKEEELEKKRKIEEEKKILTGYRLKSEDVKVRVKLYLQNLLDDDGEYLEGKGGPRPRRKEEKKRMRRDSSGLFSSLFGFLARGIGIPQDENEPQPPPSVPANDVKLRAIWQSLPTHQDFKECYSVKGTQRKLLHVNKKLYFVASKGTGRPVVSLEQFPGLMNSLWKEAKMLDNKSYTPTFMKDMPFQLSNFATCTYGHSIYCFGGKSEELKQYSNELLAFDISENEWYVVQLSETSPRPPPVTEGCLVAIANHLILLGGQTEKEKTFDDVWIFSIAKRVWSKIKQQGTLPKCRIGMSTIVGPLQTPIQREESIIPYALWTFGGVIGNQFTNLLHEGRLLWDIKAKTITSCTWTQHNVPNAPSQRCYSSALGFPCTPKDAEVPPRWSDYSTLSFDPKRTNSQHVQLLNKNRNISTIENTKSKSPGDWQTAVARVLWSKGTGIHRIRMKLNKVSTKANAYAICIGLVPPMFDTTQWNAPIGWDNPGYALIAGTGERLHNSIPSPFKEGSKCKSGDIVEMEYDSNSGILSFSRNKKIIGKVFSGIKEETLVPAISFTRGQEVEILLPEHVEATRIRRPSLPMGMLIWGGKVKHDGDRCEDNALYMLRFKKDRSLSWEIIPTWGYPPAGRQRHMLGNIGNSVYLTGGTNGNGNVQQTPYIFKLVRADRKEKGELMRRVDMSGSLRVSGNEEKKDILNIDAVVTWFREKKEIHLEVFNETELHVGVVLQLKKLIGCKVKLIGKGALVVPPRSRKTYAILSVSNPQPKCDVEFTYVVDETQGGPSFYRLQPPDDALPNDTVLNIDGGLMASRRRIEIRGVQVENKCWNICLKNAKGKYAYLELLIEPENKQIIRRVRNPEINGIESKGGCPILPGNRFVIEIGVTTTEFEIRINRKQFATYTHRLPYENVSQVVVKGDVCVTSAEMVDGPWVECSRDCFHCQRMANSDLKDITHRLLEIQATRRAMQEEEAFDSISVKIASLQRQTSMIQDHKNIRTYNSQGELKAILSQPEILAPIAWDAITNGKAFKDISFPPGKDSIGGEDKHVKKWRRASELGGKNSVLFDDSAVSSDVVQGELGDCYFLGALAVVANRYRLFRNLFIPTGISHLGLHTLQFYKDGRWRLMTVDDMIPCGGNGQPCYGRNRDKHEYWVVIAEKAYAKMHHSYHNMDGNNGGNIADALVDLTGGVPEEILFSRCQKEIESGVLFERMLEFHRKGYLLACSLVPDKKWKASLGIMDNHAYSIIDVRQINECKLIQLRNPYAKESWKGSWSSASEVWNEHFRVLLGEKNKIDKGLFWMSYYDLVRHFNILFICKVLDEENWSSKSFVSDFLISDLSAGGSIKTSRWRDNTQYSLQVLEDNTRVVISMSQKDVRISYQEKRWYQDIGFYVATNPYAPRKRIHHPVADIFEVPLTNRRTISAEMVLNKGSYVIIPHTRTPHTEGKYFMKVYYDKKSKVDRISPNMDWDFSRIRFSIKKAAEKRKEFIPLEEADKKLYDLYLAAKDKAGKSQMPQNLPELYWKCGFCGTVNVNARTICSSCFRSDVKKEIVIEKKAKRSPSARSKKRSYYNVFELSIGKCREGEGTGGFHIVLSYTGKPTYHDRVMGCSVFQIANTKATIKKDHTESKKNEEKDKIEAKTVDSKTISEDKKDKVETHNVEPKVIIEPVKASEVKSEKRENESQIAKTMNIETQNRVPNDVSYNIIQSSPIGEAREVMIHAELKYGEKYLILTQVAQDGYSYTLEVFSDTKTSLSKSSLDVSTLSKHPDYVKAQSNPHSVMKRSSTPVRESQKSKSGREKVNGKESKMYKPNEIMEIVKMAFNTDTKQEYSAVDVLDIVRKSFE